MGFDEVEQGAVAAPPCGHVSRGGRIGGGMRFEGIRCPRPAVLRILLAHGPERARYGDRCALHAGSQLGPLVAAVWDPVGGGWVAQQPEIGGRW